MIVSILAILYLLFLTSIIFGFERGITWILTMLELHGSLTAGAVFVLLCITPYQEKTILLDTIQ